MFSLPRETQEMSSTCFLFSARSSHLKLKPQLFLVEVLDFLRTIKILKIHPGKKNARLYPATFKDTWERQIAYHSCL